MGRTYKGFEGYPPPDQYSGKRRQEPQRSEERYEVRGCGDPTCTLCNSHIPREVAGAMPRRGEASGPPRGSDLAAAMSAMASGFGVRNGYVEMNGMTYYVEGSSVYMEEAPKAPPGPPPAYVAARKEVERWLVKAPEQAFDDIVGNDEALSQLRDAIRAPVEDKALYEAYGMRMPKGALLWGPPGCGKTMFARAAASEMRRLYGGDVEFLCLSGAELQAPYVGVTEAYIKSIFTFAREYRAYRGHPLLVFLDEAEVLLPDRTGRVRRVAPWEESQVATFLAEMDGVQESGAFVLLATNRPEVIDQALLRDGRCDFKVQVRRPTAEALRAILERGFRACALLRDAVDALAFAAVECLHAPHKVLVECHMLGVDLDDELRVRLEHEQRHFLLEHIVSGAMAASIPRRAVRYAFARDKAAGSEPTGVEVADVVSAVRDVYEENKGLDHSFALQEFRDQFLSEMVAAREAKMEPPSDKRALN